MREQLMNGMMAVLAGVALIELVLAFALRRPVHTFRDTLASLGLGIGQQGINVYLSASFLALFAAVHEGFAITRADLGTWWHWVLFVPACDLCYYVAHRTSHTVNFWVAAHIVHHQAEDFNHVSAMRQSWTAWIVNFPFFLPLALFVPLEMFAVGQLGIMFVQFLSHNGLVRSFGPLDRVLVTPANHRVHHGIDRPYLGMNCGGMFVIWDRVFGTYVEEVPGVPVRMGSGTDVNLFDPIDSNLDYYRRLVFAMGRREGWISKLRLWFQSPEVLFAELEQHGYRRRPSVPRSPLGAGQKAFAAAVLLGSVGLLFAHRLGYAGSGALLRVATGAALIAAVAWLGRLLSAPSAGQSPWLPAVPGARDVSPR